MSEKVYEMLWDCRYCGSRKLLGKSHRHCPSCGAPQQNAPRYFPADAEKVAVSDHVFVGADVVCPTCRSTSSRAAKHCGSCGGPLEAAASVAVQADRVHPEGVAFVGGAPGGAAPAPPAPPPRRSPLVPVLLGCGGLLAAGVVVFVLVFVFWKKDSSFEVVSRAWERTVAVERLGPVSESAWCKEMPPDAQGVRRTREQRSTNKVPNGEDCATRKVDNGDGTFREKRECKPRYKEEPVYDERCSYTVNRWAVARTERSAGGEAPAPAWPEVRLGRAGECVGCERAGARKETYTVKLAGEGGKVDECTFDAARWSAMRPKSRWKGEVRALTGGLVCDSLAPR
ncbi:MAG TPA: hypothetical protein VFS00_34315 [Polyangiaceae bacterium]|nr:hypothetical protein [Polyangiaceae bacterium]